MLCIVFFSSAVCVVSAFSALTAGHHEEHPACKSHEVLVWLSVSSEVHIVCI